MKTIYFTITGTNHCYGTEFMEAGQDVRLIKDVDNEFDSEAIRVEMDGLGQVGFVANSTYTVIGESVSAGRLYDKIADTASGRIKYVLPKGVLCELDGASIVRYEGLEDDEAGTE